MISEKAEKSPGPGHKLDLKKEGGKLLQEFIPLAYGPEISV